MTYLFAAGLGIGGWLISLVIQAAIATTITSQYRRKVGTPERVAQLQAPVDALLSGIIHEPVRVAMIWWLISTGTVGTFSWFGPEIPESPFLLALAFAAGWALAELIHLIVIVRVTMKRASAEEQQDFRETGLVNPRIMTMRVLEIILRNIGLTLLLITLPILVVVTLTARAASSLLATRTMIFNTQDPETKRANSLISTELLAAIIFAILGLAVVAIN